MTLRPANRPDDSEESSKAIPPPAVKVKIVPANLEVGVRPGEILLDVLRRAGMVIEAECGTQGTCGRCAVQILSGRCQWPGSETLAAEKFREGYVLSCQARVSEDLVVRILETDMESPGADPTPYLVSAPAPASPSDLSPLTEKVVLEIPPVSLGEQVSDLDRLLHRLARNSKLHCPLAALRSLPDAVRQSQGKITVTMVEEGSRRSVVKIEPGDCTGRHFGVACDIGTTTVALQLVDLARGRVLDTVAGYNRQIECGADVISRIIYAQKEARLADLRFRIVNTINGLLDVVLPRQGVAPEEVTCAVFAGNTTMTHLALGINPQSIREEPYVPAVKTVPLYSAGALDLHLWPDAPVLFAPGVGSYVGGDITAGMLSAQLAQGRNGTTLFIDIGTNGELVLSGDDWMISCACSAGPAFEGVGISCGMRAAPGAIETVEVKPGGAELVCRTVGDQAPKGICGSGLIELVAGLFLQGVIGRDGRFNETQANPRLRLEDHSRAFVVVEAAQTATGKAIRLSERDITNLMRAKAAIYSACSLFLKKVGLTIKEIDWVQIAGGFGCHLDVSKAIALGLFPDIDPGRFTYLGNTSLQGACLALLAREHRQHLSEIARKMTYIDLSNEREYLEEYTGALFLPHTETALFPTVMGKPHSPHGLDSLKE